MANKNKHRIIEELIPIVMTLAFVLGFFLIQGGITGLVVFENNHIQTFEVNSVIPATSTLEIISGTQKAEIPLSEFTIKLTDLTNIQPILVNNNLVAYNITNMTINLASYNIKPAESVTIRFVEVYKEITKEIAVAQEIPEIVEVPKVVEENITVIPEEVPEITPVLVEPSITFGRTITCDKCGQHKVPSSTYLTMTVSATSETLLNKTVFADYIPVEWIVINPYDGKVEYIGDGYKKITWDVENTTEISKTYVVQSPKIKSADYTFKSELAGTISDPWIITVEEGVIVTTKTTVLEPVFKTTEKQFEIQDTSPLTVNTATEIVSCLTWTNPEAELNTNDGSFSDVSCDPGDKFYATWTNITGCSDSDAVTSVKTSVKVWVEDNGFLANGFHYYLSNSAADDGGTIYCTASETPAATTSFSVFQIDCSVAVLDTVKEVNEMKAHYDNEDSAQKEWFQIDHINVTVIHDCTTPDTDPPKVENRIPYNNTNWTTASINFTYNVTDALSAIDTCQLWLQKAGTWTINDTNTTITEGIKNNTINITLEDSSFLWKVECNDTSTTQENRGNSTTFNITIDSHAPIVENLIPKNSTRSQIHSVNFTYNVTDYSRIDNCSLYLTHSYSGTWERNKTDSNIETLQNQTLNITLMHENVYWKVGCYDSFAQQGNSSAFNYTVYNMAPVVNISIPKNDTQGYVHSVNFTYNVSGNGDEIDNCSLFLKHSYAGTWERNKTTIVTPVVEIINNTFNLTLMHENVYWKVGCYDEFALQANSSTFNYTVLQALPTVNRSIPKNNTLYTNTNYINFTYNVTVPGPETPQACELYIDGAWNATDYTITEGINQSFNITFDFGTYKWQVGCNSSEGFTNTTTYNFSTAEITNVAPTICCRRASTIDQQTINIDSWKSISVTFNVTDADGTDNLKAFANLTGTGDDDGDNEYIDYNLSCVYTGKSNATSKEFNCSTKIWYFFKPGSWNISVNATDSVLWVHNKTMANIDLAQTKAITISPTSLTWPSVNVGTWNQTSNNDPIIINNTGNYNVSLGKVNITAYDLHGESAGKESEEIPAANFTVDIETGGICTGAACIECDGTAMNNATSINIANSILPLGNHSMPDGKTAEENISVCLVNVPWSNMITPGISYSTAESKQWIIGIS